MTKGLNKTKLRPAQTKLKESFGREALIEGEKEMAETKIVDYVSDSVVTLTSILPHYNSLK